MLGDLIRMAFRACLPRKVTPAEHLMFPPKHMTDVVATGLYGVRPSAADSFDLTTPSGMAQAQMGHDPLTNEFLAGLDGHRRNG